MGLRVISISSRFFDAWICTHCQTENISLVYPDQCSCCSMPRDPAAQQVRSEVEIDSEFYRDNLEGKCAWYCGFCKRQQLGIIGAESDWLCTHCGTGFQDPEHPGEKEGSGVVRKGEVLPEDRSRHFQDRVGPDKYVPHADHAAIQIGQKPTSEYNEWGSPTPIQGGRRIPRWPWSKKTTLIGLAGVMLGIPGVMILAWLFYKGATTYQYDYYQVDAGYWSRTIKIEQSSVEDGEGFQLPTGATKLREEDRHDGSYRKEDDPSGATEPEDVYDWVAQDPIIVPCEVHEGNTAVADATCEEDVPHKREVVDTIMVPVQVDVPNMAPYYFYQETVWSAISPKVAAEVNFNPYWPSVSFASNQRESSRNSVYGIATIDMITGISIDREISSETEWRRYESLIGTCFLEVENLFGQVQSFQEFPDCPTWGELEPTLEDLN